MERSFALVLTLVTLVTATPHGYGVKGGASAKAEASAVAGGFGDLPIPLSIPAGSAYSGSFSKSSSSSFASSSASSSSSSFSFSGSGANGIAGSGNDKGCSSGTCPGAGNDGASLNGAQHFTGASAGSAAQAKALSGAYTPCQGLNCKDSPSEKCTSGQCAPGSTLKGQSECKGNGDCQSPSGKPDLSIDSSSNRQENDKQEGNARDSNDFAVNINRNSQPKLSHDSNGQYSNNENAHNPGPDCSNGKCGPNNSDHSSIGSNQKPYPVPSTYLTAPNLNPPCTTPNCNYPSQNGGLQTSGLPSSYNVPIQSATNAPNTYYSVPTGYNSNSNAENSVNLGVPCTSPSCSSTQNNIRNSNVPNYNIGHQGPSNSKPCTSGQCHIPLSSNLKPNSGALPDVPNYSPGSIPSNIPSGPSGQPGCTSPQCLGYPTHSSLPANQPVSGCSGTACNGNPQSGSPAKPSDSDGPVYTGGFGGPAGFLDIASGSNKLHGNSGYGNSHNTPATIKPTGTFGSTPIQASSGTTYPYSSNSNNDYGSTQTSSISGSSGAFQYNKPSSVSPSPGSQFKPSPTNSYGAPTASSTVPLGTIAHSDDNGTYKPSLSHGASPSYSGGIQDSTGSSHTSSGSNSIHGSFGVTKPNIPSNTLSSPAYTHGFGGPSGPEGATGLSHGPTGSFSKPGFGNCGSANCNGQVDITAPNTSSQKKPTYNGGFGGPSGFLKPNNYNVPSNTPTGSSENVPCANDNCGSKVSPSSNQGTSLTSAHSVAAASASANAVAYSGGFGGPPGVLKPYDEGKVNIPAHGNLANGHPLPSNNGQPGSPSVNGKDLKPDSYPNGANAGAHASATALATAGSYSGNNNNGASHGCNSGCSSNGPAEIASPDGHIKNGLGAGSIASAKSTAGANAYGGSYASSSASAHATAGAATKGGYGRK